MVNNGITELTRSIEAAISCGINASLSQAFSSSSSVEMLVQRFVVRVPLVKTSTSSIVDTQVDENTQIDENLQLSGESIPPSGVLRVDNEKDRETVDAIDADVESKLTEIRDTIQLVGQTTNEQSLAETEVKDDVESNDVKDDSSVCVVEDSVVSSGVLPESTDSEERKGTEAANTNLAEDHDSISVSSEEKQDDDKGNSDSSSDGVPQFPVSPPRNIRSSVRASTIRSRSEDKGTTQLIRMLIINVYMIFKVSFRTKGEENSSEG